MTNMDFLPFIVAAFFVIFFIAVISIIVSSSLRFSRENKSIIERARKIDPSVKTISEAHYVLQKDMYQSFGSKKDDDNK